MPTLNFLIYLAAVGFAYLFKLSYVGWFGPYLLAAVIFVPLLLVLLSLPAMLLCELSLRAVPCCTQKSEARLRVVFKTPPVLPLGNVKIHLEIENLFAGERWLERPVFQSVRSGMASVPLPTALCGVLRCQVIRYECRDVLGLFAVRRQGPPALFCTVLPEAQAPDTPIHLEAALQTFAHFKPKYGGGYSEEHDLREYRPGDTVNSIHWKLSAKTDQVIVREPLERENQEVFLVLARVGAEDRGLKVLYWLSRALCELEVPHAIVGDRIYTVGNEQETVDALSGILRVPLTEPCPYNAADARCIFLISAGEVRVL